MDLQLKLHNFFSNQIVTRKAMANFFVCLSNYSNKDIILDFKDIDFISRSCADEYIKRKLNSKKNIIELNMNSRVMAMFTLAGMQYKREIGILI